MKVRSSKARKSTHKKGRATKTIRRKVLRKEANNDPDKEWEIEEMGPVYLLWGKKVRAQKGKTIKWVKYYVRKNDKHRIWVKWATRFSDLNTQWSAERQSKHNLSKLSK